VRIQIEVIPKDLADKASVGKGREEPNQNPFLPAPEGRISMTLNPMKLISQLVSPDILFRIK